MKKTHVLLLLLTLSGLGSQELLGMRRVFGLLGGGATAASNAVQDPAAAVAALSATESSRATMVPSGLTTSVRTFLGATPADAADAP